MSGKRVAVVTGSNKGIGFSIVKELCSTFDGIVYLTSRDEGRGMAAVQELNKLGLHPKYHQLDIDDQSSVLRLRDFLKVKYGGLDVLVNNAAIAMIEPGNDCTVEQATGTLQTNFFNMLTTCKILFPILKPHARVVNMSSCMGHISMIRGTGNAAMELKEKLTSRNLTEEELCNLMQDFVDSVKRGDHGNRGWPTIASPPYTVSKIGISALTRIQQREFDQDSRPDLIVNCVHPGFVSTDMTLFQGPLTPEEGAAAPSWLALLAKNIESPKGEYVWFNKKIVDWVHGPMAECVGVDSLNKLYAMTEGQ